MIQKNERSVKRHLKPGGVKYINEWVGKLVYYLAIDNLAHGDEIVGAISEAAAKAVRREVKKRGVTK